MVIQFSKTLEKITGCEQTEISFASSTIYSYELIRVLKTMYSELSEVSHWIIYNSEMCCNNEGEIISTEQKVIVDFER
jgi:hypothetical protein